MDAHGRVVGVNTSGPRSMVLTIPPSTVNRVVGQLLEKGRIARGYLGLGMQPVRLPESLKQTVNLSGTSGVIIVAVEPNSPPKELACLSVTCWWLWMACQSATPPMSKLCSDQSG